MKLQASNHLDPKGKGDHSLLWGVFDQNQHQTQCLLKFHHIHFAALGVCWDV